MDIEDGTHSVHHVVVHVRRLAYVETSTRFGPQNGTEPSAIVWPREAPQGTPLASANWPGGLGLAAARPCVQHKGSRYQNTTANLVHQKVVTKAMLVNRYARGKRGASVAQKTGSADLQTRFKKLQVQMAVSIQIRHSATVLTAPAYKSPISRRGGAHNAFLRVCEITKRETRCRMTKG
jgi:hypothetical protein